MPLPSDRLTFQLWIAVAATALCGAAFAQAPAAVDKTKVVKPAADPRQVVVDKINGLKLDDVRISPVPGIYEITRDSEVSYTSADGRYVILGDMIDINSDSNLSEARRRGIRARLIETVPENEMLIFAPKAAPKYTVTVFTDVDCGYCRRLHSQIAEYNRLGIRVRYLFYPRSGPDTDSWHKAESVWCAANRNDALTRAKNGEAIKSPACPTDIVARDWELGHKLMVEGTPAIFLASGEMLPGYMPPSQLAQYLKTGKL